MKKIVLFFLAAILASFSAYADREIKGTVVSEADGEPLIGASVVPVGVGGGGTATDFDGNFAIVLPDGVDDITVSYIGMQAKTVKAADGMTVKLQENATVLEGCGGHGVRHEARPESARLCRAGLEGRRAEHERDDRPRQRYPR